MLHRARDRCRGENEPAESASGRSPSELPYRKQTRNPPSERPKSHYRRRVYGRNTRRFRRVMRRHEWNDRTGSWRHFSAGRTSGSRRQVSRMMNPQRRCRRQTRLIGRRGNHPPDRKARSCVHGAHRAAASRRFMGCPESTPSVRAGKVLSCDKRGRNSVRFDRRRAHNSRVIRKCGPAVGNSNRSDTTIHPCLR